MPVLSTALVLIAGKILLKKLAKTLLEHWTESEWVADVIVDGAEKVGERALERIYADPKEKVAEAFDAIANADPADLDAALNQAVAEAAPDQSAECQAALRANLSVAAQRMRQARTLAAPNAAGQPTIPPSLLPTSPEELLRYLPILPPSGWRPGDTLYPGARQYTFVRLLGIGGFGEVWETRNANRPGDAHRAVKVFSHRDAAKYIAREEANMRRVIDMMATAPHPGIVPIIDQNLDRIPPSLAYELVEGQELTWLIRKWHAEREGPTPAEAARLLLRLAEIVAHCHAHGIIHRDLKPANILVDAPGRMHITDFGLSQATAAAEGQGEAARERQSRPSLTALKGSGTAGYASPEQFDRNVPADVRDDIHALGVIGYELLTNTLPRGGLSRAMSRTLIASGVPESLVDALSDCLEQKREHRLGSAAELVKILAEVAGTEPTGQATGPSTGLAGGGGNFQAKQSRKKKNKRKRLAGGGGNVQAKQPTRTDENLSERAQFDASRAILRTPTATATTAPRQQLQGNQSPARSCQRCKKRVPQGELVCPHCGCLERGAVVVAFVAAGGGNLAAYFCDPGIWRWLCNGLGAFFLLTAIVPIIRSVTWTKKPDYLESLPQSGKPALSVDQIARPGTVISGSVTYRDGKTAGWHLDQQGRLGIVPPETGYRPPDGDSEEFQSALDRELQKRGL